MANDSEHGTESPAGHGEEVPNDEGVITAIIERMEQQHLPRALDLKDKVDHGDPLDDFDIAFLERVFAECEEMRPLLERHPELAELAARMMSLYHAITAQALDNERQRTDSADGQERT